MIFKIRKLLKKNSPPLFEFFRYLYNLRFLVRALNIELNNDYRNTVIISGTGRSGTTWIADILNYNNGYRYMFEPFSPKEVRIFKKTGELPYLRPQNKAPRIYELVKKVLSGRIRGGWISKGNHKFISRKRLVKEIHINIALKWIKSNFPEIPVILLLRHPFAVAYSKTRLSWWDADRIMKIYLNQEDLVEDFLKDKIEAASKLEDDFSRFIFIWCIENIVPLSQFSRGEIHLAFYENFCRDPRSEIKRMFDFLGKDMDEGVLDAVRKPSRVTREDSAIFKGRNPVSDWKDKLTQGQIKSAMEILKLFGLHKIYSEDVMPDTGEAFKFLNNMAEST